MPFRENWDTFADKFMKFFGLRPYAPGARMVDPYNIYMDADDPDDKRALRVAIFIALVFHVLLLLIRFATATGVFIPDNKQIITLRNLAGPQLAGGGGGGRPKTAPKTIELPKPKPQPIPFPDPTPDEPEPLYQVVTENAPQIVAQIGNEFSIGDINAPPGPGGIGGSGPGSGGGTGGGTGRGIGPGIGDGVYGVG